jgi:tetratricopeptide (TPR) repeat protein
MKALGRIPLAGLLVVVVALLGCKAPIPLPPQAVELNRLGAVAFSLGDAETAEVRFALAIEYHPRFTEAWVNLGLVEMSRGNFVLAKKDFEKARDLNEDLPAPHHALGLLADRRGQGPIAEHHYKAALKVDPGFAPARANLGRLDFQRGAFDDAREQFERLTEAAPEAIEGWTGLTESLLRLGREDDADAALGRGRARLGDRPELLLLVARQLLRRGAFPEAEEILAPLTGYADARHQSAAWSWIAVARVGEGRPGEAMLAASEALRADANDPLAKHAMSEALALSRSRSASSVVPGRSAQ